MSACVRWLRVGGALVVTSLAASHTAQAQGALSMDEFVTIVLRTHPSAAGIAGLELAAEAERKASRVLPDPVFEFSWDHATPTESPGTQTETAYSVSQTIPWPGTYSAGKHAGNRAADALLARAEAVGWELRADARQAFSRLAAGRALLEVARAAETDARSLRDLVIRRAELGEARESDRIKAEVEWLRQQRSLASAEREAAALEAIARALAIEPLPTPLELSVAERPPLPRIDPETLRARLVEQNPRQRAAQAEAARQQALLSVARRGRVPDLGVSVFRDNEIDKQANGFSVGIRVPLWNANRGEIARAQAAVQVSAAEAGRVRIELAAELEGRVKELEIAGAQVTLLESQIVPAATRSVGLARLSYEEGETSLLDLLDAQRTFREAQREAADANLALSLAVAEVQRLVGPDFSPWSSR